MAYKVKVIVPWGHLWEPTISVANRMDDSAVFDLDRGVPVTGSEYDEGIKVERIRIDGRENLISPAVFRPQKAIRLMVDGECPSIQGYHVMINGIDITVEDSLEMAEERGTLEHMPELTGRFINIAAMNEEQIRQALREYEIDCEVYIGARPTRLCFGFDGKRYGLEGEDFADFEILKELFKKVELETGSYPSVATEYPNIASKFLDENGMHAVVVPSYGMTENYIREGATHFIVDTVESGKSRKKAGIVTVLPALLESASFLGTTPKIKAKVATNGVGKNYTAFVDDFGSTAYRTRMDENMTRLYADKMGMRTR